MPEEIKLYAAGEVCVNRDDPDSIVAFVADKMSEADVSFCQLETTISERGTPSEQPCNMRVHPRNISALKRMKLDVACLAGNHAMDWGREALEDTIALLTRDGIQPFGAGANVMEALKPAFVEKDGARIAFLGINCNLPEESWAATDRKPGCAALRVRECYISKSIHPASHPEIQSFPDRRDFGPILEAVRAAKKAADLVAVSLHWGLFMPPHYIVDYQTDVAHQLIDAGADMILGTGPHQIKPIEVYKGKVIFYSLGNFAFDWGRKSGIDLDVIVPQGFAKLSAETGWDLDEDWLDHFVFPSRGRKAIVGKWLIEGGKINRVSFMPVMINRFAQPAILGDRDDEFLDVVNYVKELCSAAELDTRFEIEGDEVVIGI